MTEAVMVTGAGGFVGRHVVNELKKRGISVLAAYYNRKPPEADGINWIHLDMDDAAQLDRVLKEYGPKYLIHCAWYVNPGDYMHSFKNLDSVRSGLLLYRLFYEYGGIKALYTGTCFEYDLSEKNVFFCEDAPLKPSTLYGRAKASLSEILDFQRAHSSRDFVWARLFYMYGPCEYKERIIPYVINSLLRGIRPQVSHGLQIRDYSYVSDVAGALVQVLLSDFSGIINIGSGKGVTLKHMFELLEKETGFRGVDFGAVKTPADEPKEIVADIRKLRALGIEMPTPIEKGLKLSCDYWKSTVR